MEYLPKPDNRFRVIFGLEVFTEFSKLTGEYFVDSGPYYREINHRKYYVGLAPQFKLSFRLMDQLVLIAATRLRFGYYSAEGIGVRQGQWEIQPDYQAWQGIWEPLS